MADADDAGPPVRASTRKGPGRLFDAATVVRSLPSVALVVIASVLSYRYHTLLTAQRGRVEHTYRVLTQLDRTSTALLETAQRGFPFSGDERSLAPYRRSSVETPAAIARLRALVSDRPDQQRGRVDAIERLATTKFAELDATIVARRARGLEAARALVVEDRGRATMDEARGVTAAMGRTELDLPAARGDDIRATAHRLLAMTVTCAVPSIVARIGLVDREASRDRVALTARRGVRSA